MATPGPPWAPQIDELIELRARGVHYKEIAQRLGRKPVAVLRKLRKLGLGVGQPRPRWSASETAQIRAAIASAWRAGATIAEAAHQANCSYDYAYTTVSALPDYSPPYRTREQIITMRAELEDAIERWGIEGAAEEYEVQPCTIKKWLHRAQEVTP